MGFWKGLEFVMEFILKCLLIGYILREKSYRFFSFLDRNFIVWRMFLVEDE